MPRHYSIWDAGAGTQHDIKLTKDQEIQRDLEEAAAEEAHQLSLDTDEARVRAIVSLKAKLAKVGLSAAEIEAVL